MSLHHKVFARKYPLLETGVIAKITLNNGFTQTEINKYRKAVRSLPQTMEGAFHDTRHIIQSFTWETSPQGQCFWSDLSTRLDKIEPRRNSPKPVSIPDNL